MDGVELWIALAGVAIATVSLVWQIFDKFASRPRLDVTTAVSTFGTIDGDFIRNFCVASVTAHALNGPVGVKSIEWALPPGLGYNISAFQSIGVENQIDLANDHRALNNGETVTWRFRITSPGGRSLPKGTTVTPTVVLVSGKRIRASSLTLFEDSLTRNRHL